MLGIASRLLGGRGSFNFYGDRDSIVALHSILSFSSVISQKGPHGGRGSDPELHDSKAPREWDLTVLFYNDLHISQRMCRMCNWT